MSLNHDYFTKFISDHKNSNMLLIQDVKFINVPNDIYELEDLVLTHFLKHENPYSEKARQISQETEGIQREIIRGIRFTNHRGDEVCIGIPERIQGILGLPFSSFKNFQEEIEKLKWVKQKLMKENKQLTSEINEFKEMKLWKRILFLFKGEKALTKKTV